jgi:hypothetical protein
MHVGLALDAMSYVAVTVPGSGTMDLASYDTNGRIRQVTRADGRIAMVVPPDGFALLTR